MKNFLAIVLICAACKRVDSNGRTIPEIIPIPCGRKVLNFGDPGLNTNVVGSRPLRDDEQPELIQLSDTSGDVRYTIQETRCPRP